MTDLIRRAHAFAIAAHAGQRRRYTLEPYVVHCGEVARLVASAGCDDEVVAAAWLHDVAEDCGVKFGTLSELFGPMVARYVALLTDAEPSYGNRAHRKAMDRERLSEAPNDVKTIKLADLIDNTSTIVRHDPGFARIYLPEKERLLEVLDGGDAGLMKIARQMVDDGMRWLMETAI